MVLQTALKYFDSWSKDSGKFPCKPHIVTTTVEHDAVSLPLRHFKNQQQASREKHSRLFFFQVNLSYLY